MVVIVRVSLQSFPLYYAWHSSGPLATIVGLFSVACLLDTKRPLSGQLLACCPRLRLRSYSAHRQQNTLSPYSTWHCQQNSLSRLLLVVKRYVTTCLQWMVIEITGTILIYIQLSDSSVRALSAPEAYRSHPLNSDLLRNGRPDVPCQMDEL